MHERPEPGRSGSADFVARDPNSPAFWDERFERGFTLGPGWRASRIQGVRRATRRRCRVDPRLRQRLGGALAGSPGQPVQAIDFSPAAVATARAQLGASTPRSSSRPISSPGSHRRRPAGSTNARSCARCPSRAGRITRGAWPSFCRPARCWRASIFWVRRRKGRHSASSAPNWTRLSPYFDLLKTSRSVTRLRCLPAVNAGLPGAAGLAAGLELASSAPICADGGCVSRSPPKTGVGDCLRL